MGERYIVVQNFKKIYNENRQDDKSENADMQITSQQREVVQNYAKIIKNKLNQL